MTAFGAIETERPVAAVERALDVLRAFREGDTALTLADLAARTGFHKSTILRLAGTLEAADFLERQNDGAWRIGHACLHLARLHQAALRPAERVVPVLEHLVAQTLESAVYSVRRGDVRVCLYRVDSPQMLRDHARPGDITPLQRGASGHVFLAFDRPHAAKFAGVRRTCLAMTAGEMGEPGLMALAAPIFGPSATVEGALAVVGPEVRLPPPVVARTGRLLRQAAARLTRELGGDPAPLLAAGD